MMPPPLKSWVCLLFLLSACNRRESTLRSIPALNGDIVQAFELSDSLRHHDWLIVDTRTQTEYVAGHIPGAVNLDWSRVTPRDAVTPFSLLPSDSLKNLFCANGVVPQRRLVLYSHGDPENPEYWGSEGLFYWIFRFYRFDSIRVLNGGFKAWLGAGGPVNSGEAMAVELESCNWTM
ncbi:MAG: hypothetical protein GF344_00005, partial [Chitinivibrionales bacterium]|nr:hypothetical protein [Chitinivibrionales bacterium]MBD3355512.1 hypothetical protein [Chitinivibrionales bacterium]